MTKEKILKTEKKKDITYWRAIIRITANFLSETVQCKPEGSRTSLKYWRGGGAIQSKTLYLVKNILQK